MTYEVDNNKKLDEKPIKKRGRKPKANRKGYFYEEEEEAFIKYVTSTDQHERDKVFREKLYPAFTKMIESIIRRYELFTPSEDFTDTFYDTMSFLLTKVNNYDASKGFKVYSYCGTVCKNYLIMKRTNSMKKRDKQVSYDMMFPNADKDTRTDMSQETLTLNFNIELINKTIEEIQLMLSDEKIDSLTENEKKIGYALLEMLMNWEDIFKRVETKKFNKTSVLYFIKEYTRLSTKEVRDAMKKYKSLYFFTKQKLIDE